VSCGLSDDSGIARVRLRILELDPPRIFEAPLDRLGYFLKCDPSSQQSKEINRLVLELPAKGFSTFLTIYPQEINDPQMIRPQKDRPVLQQYFCP